MAHRFVVLCADGVPAIDVAGVVDVLDAANRIVAAEGRPAPYETILASLAGGPLACTSGIQLHTRALAGVGAIDTLVVPGAFPRIDPLTEPAFVAAVRHGAAGARRVVSVCNGAFALGAAGLLDGRRVTTHWSQCAALAAAHPTATVEADRIFVRDGDLVTSGGASSGIDLALALVESDLGAAIARTAARWLVVYLHRPGGQSQFSAPPAAPATTVAPIEAAVRAIHAEPTADHRVATLADAVGLSRRHFARVFQAETGTTPARYVEGVRVEVAARLLESTTYDHETVARRSGFSSAEVMRQVFRRERGVTPGQHRRRFATTAGDP